MVDITTAQFWISVFEIIVIDLLLSGDNAVVIALACRNLGPRHRRLGIICGVTGAVVLRILLTVFAASLLSLHWLKLVGGALLLWIGIKLIAEDNSANREVEASDRLWRAIRTVIIADAVMSLDNVIGVAGASKGSVPLLVFGLALSIPIVVIGSQLFLRLFKKYPVLVVAGGGLLGYIAGSIGTEDTVVAPWIVANAPQLGVIVPIGGFLLVALVGSWLAQRSSVKI